MTRPWIGGGRYLFIPLVVEGVPGYDPPPAGYREFVRRRVVRDLDPQTNEDRSLASYISAVSYQRANVDATIANPVTLRNLQEDQSPTLEAIYGHPESHLYEYLAVVYPPNRRGAGSGMAQPGRIQFDPPRTPNRTRARSRFRHNDPIGTWAMEVIHNVTDINDYYNGVKGPDRFEEMDAAEASHPSAFTKLAAGWLDPDDVPVHPGGARRYTLHAIALPRPSPARRVAGIRIAAPGSDRYLIVEARLRSDRWDRGFSGSTGIPSEGVVVYEYAPDWPRNRVPGPRPPLQLRTPTALGVGQRFTHHDTSTPYSGSGPRVYDHRRNVGRQREVTVRSAVNGGFVVEVAIDGARVPSGTGSQGAGTGRQDRPPRREP